MKKIDFSHAGGFPLTQNQINYLQTAYSECINALSNMGSDGSTPVMIWGMVKSIPSPGTVTVSDGWFFYNNELVKFSGGTITPGTGEVPLVQILSSSTLLTYNDGSVFPAVLEKNAILVSGTTMTDPTHFPYDAMLPYQYFFGINGRETTFKSIDVNTDVTLGGVTGTVYYKKDFLNNTLQLRGVLTANHAQNFNGSPSAHFYSMGTLDSEYIPASNSYFTAHYYLAGQIKDDLNIAWIKQLTCFVNDVGEITINWIKPDSAVSGYTVSFNAVIPLD